MQAVGPVLLRLAIGAVFVAHGGQKLFGIWGGGGPGGTAAYFDALGLAPAYPLALLVGAVEFFGGLMLIAGAFTVIVAAGLACIMAVATWLVHLPNGFFLNWVNAPGEGHGFEFHLVLLAGLGCLMLAGPGAASVDSWRRQSAETEAAGRARLRSGSV